MSSRKRQRTSSMTSSKKPSKKLRLAKSGLSVPNPIAKKVDVLSWGGGDFEQLGIVNKKKLEQSDSDSDSEDLFVQERKFPANVKDLQGVNVKNLTCGALWSAVVTDEGKVFSWGCNDDFVLGRPNDDSDAPNCFPAEVPGLEDVVQVSGGEQHGAVLTSEGKIYYWGSYKESDGPLGFNASNDIFYKQKTPVPLDARHIRDKFVQVESGNQATFALTSRGKVYEWGALKRSEKVLRRNQDWLKPRPVYAPTADKIWVGGFHCFLKERKTGDIFAWGLGNMGQLGLGNEENLERPQRVEALSEYSIIQIACGEQSTLALSDKGEVLAFGSSRFGQLGLGQQAKDDFKVVTPTIIPFFEELRTKEKEKAVAVRSGAWHSIVLTDKGNMYSFGFATEYRLGNGDDDEDQVSPALVKGQNLKTGEVVDVQSGCSHNIILMKK